MHVNLSLQLGGTVWPFGGTVQERDASIKDRSHGRPHLAIRRCIGFWEQAPCWYPWQVHRIKGCEHCKGDCAASLRALESA